MAKKMLAALVAALMLMMGLVPSVLNASTAAADSNSNFILHNNEQSAPESAAQENPDLPGSGAIAPAVNFTNAAPLMDFSTPENGVMGALADDDPLKLSKTVTKNMDGTYTVHLEAYTTGEITTRKTPCDIVLVLDQSGSMHAVMQENVGWHYRKVYGDIDSLTHDNSYYYLENGQYKTAYWCNGIGITSSHDPGWYTVSHNFFSHGGTRLEPVLVPGDEGTQFYEHANNYTRMEILIQALDGFIDSVRSEALGDDNQAGTDDDVKHRIAVVGFGADAEHQPNMQFLCTELLIGANKYNYGNTGFSTDNATLASAKYGSALQNMWENTGNNNVHASIDALTDIPYSLTFSNFGLEMAKDIFENAVPTSTNGTPDTRNKVTVFFTDGFPGYNDAGWSSTQTNPDFNLCYITGNKAITQAKTIKENDTTVYAVGIFEGASGVLPLPNYHDGYVSGGYGYGDISTMQDLYDNANRYMHYVSSNYPAAGTNIEDSYPQNPDLDGDSYYLSASDSNALNAIFNSISSQINAGSEADETTEVRDVLSPYFQLPESATENDIIVKTAKAKSGAFSNPDDPNSWEDPETFTPPSGINPQTDENYGVHIGQDPDRNAKVSVDGFDFMANFVSESGRPEPPATGTIGNFFGRKLIIEFNIVPKPGFLGGNDVPTNGDASGVYNPPGDNGDLLGAFPNNNKFDIPIPDISVTVPDKNVYLYGALTDEQLKAGAIATAGTGNNAITIKLDAQDFALDPWQYEFVNITPTVSPGNFTALTNDTTYTVSVTIAPKDTTGTVTEKSASADGKINVFKPELTFKDSEACYGGKAPENPGGYNTDNYVSTVWKHGETVDSDVTMMGDKPTLGLTYTPKADCIKTVSGMDYIVTRDDIPVKVTVKIDAADATAHVKFIHQACTNETGCGWDELQPTPANGDPAFLLHVKTCTLTVGKQLTNSKKYQPGESFIFHISGNNPALPIEMEVVAHVGEDGNVAEIVIKELPVGSYTVTEDTGWSWRYEVTGENGVTVELKCEGDRAETANFTNNLVSNKWLTWEAAVDNRWNSTGEIDKAILPKPEP